MAEKNRKKWELLLAPFILLMLMTFSVYAEPTITIDAPATSSTIYGATNQLQATLTNILNNGWGSSIANATYSQWSYRSGTTGAWTLITPVNTTQNETIYYGNLDTTGLTETSTYQINWTVMNISGFNASATNTGITLDNTVPTIVLRIDKDFVTALVEGLEYDCRDSADGFDTSLTFFTSLRDPDGTTLTTALNSFGTFSSDNFIVRGEYTVDCGAVDNGRNSANATKTFNVKGKKAVSVSPQLADELTKPDKSSRTNVLMIILVLVVVVVIFGGGSLILFSKK